MGLFENLGRKAGRLQRAVEEAAAEEVSHECGACGERFYADHDRCPECGADAIAPV